MNKETTEGMNLHNNAVVIHNYLKVFFPKMMLDETPKKGKCMPDETPEGFCMFIYNQKDNGGKKKSKRSLSRNASN